MTATLHSYRGYVFRIEYDADDPVFIVDFLHIPDIITQRLKALRSIRPRM